MSGREWDGGRFSASLVEKDGVPFVRLWGYGLPDLVPLDDDGEEAAAILKDHGADWLDLSRFRGWLASFGFYDARISSAFYDFDRMDASAEAMAARIAKRLGMRTDDVLPRVKVERWRAGI